IRDFRSRKSSTLHAIENRESRVENSRARLGSAASRGKAEARGAGAALQMAGPHHGRNRPRSRDEISLWSRSTYRPDSRYRRHELRFGLRVRSDSSGAARGTENSIGTDVAEYPAQRTYWRYPLCWVCVFLLVQ